ncbi:Chondroitin polymerase [Hartmannibacter diazotrophicus]|uniref:Chondroitin polymerase n=1 Tax=Hartmannibacter diazotrophicus TaxID=1482074 RepID=A0A2C9D0Y1_9HYPH|nr:glycosyltransferase family 2 protein [Hartmannibacter diazotrophicus]SON53910.1 Chondroitin polymerase [Hartmannibacter diazotrophicus]
MSEPLPTPRVAVAIPCYNQARFLSQAIESALNQTRPPDEIIVVDDGSPDNTAEVAAAYPQVRYHRQANGGVSAARNAGLAITTCDHILFLDADDTLEPETIALGLACLQANPEAAFAYGGYREVDEALTLIHEHPVNPTGQTYGGLLTGNHIVMPGAVLYRASPLKEVGGFDTSLTSWEDHDVYLKLARAHPVACYSSIAGNYRRHGTSMSRNSLRMLKVGHVVLDRQRPHVQGQPSLEEALRKGRVNLDRYYGDQLASAILSGLCSRRTVLPSIASFWKGLQHNWRLVLWLARTGAIKITGKITSKINGKTVQPRSTR